MIKFLWQLSPLLNVTDQEWLAICLEMNKAIQRGLIERKIEDQRRWQTLWKLRIGLKTI